MFNNLFRFLNYFNIFYNCLFILFTL